MIRVGQKLKEERERQGYSLEDVAKATKIRSVFLKDIEEGNYKSLPSVTYVQGFVKNYIEFLGLQERPLLALFRREFNEREYVSVLPENVSARKEIALNQVRIRQAVILGALVIVGLFVYIFFQYHAAFFSPSLSISEPKENATITSQVVNITGHTEADTSVTINGIPVFVEGNGNFTKQIAVFSGATTLTIQSVNSFGKTSTVIRHISVR